MIKCPNCGVRITAFDFGIYTYKDAINYTFACPSCDVFLLAQKDGPVVVNDGNLGDVKGIAIPQEGIKEDFQS